MFKVADKMASVCLWVETTAGAFQDLIRRPEGMYVRHPPPGRGTTAKLRNSKCNTHTHTHTCIHHIHRFAKKSMENGYAIYFFYKVRNKRNV